MSIRVNGYQNTVQRNILNEAGTYCMVSVETTKSEKTSHTMNEERVETVTRGCASSLQPLPYNSCLLYRLAAFCFRVAKVSCAAADSLLMCTEAVST